MQVAIYLRDVGIIKIIVPHIMAIHDMTASTNGTEYWTCFKDASNHLVLILPSIR